MILLLQCIWKNVYYAIFKIWLKLISIFWLQAMSIVSDMITKKQFDKLQGMIDSEVMYWLNAVLLKLLN